VLLSSNYGLDECQTLLFRGRRDVHVDIDLSLLAAKQPGSVSEKRQHNYDHKNYQYRDNSNAATTTPIIACH
jgi:hypothetical protein